MNGSNCDENMMKHDSLIHSKTKLSTAKNLHLYYSPLNDDQS